MWSNIGTILFDYDIKDSIMGKVIERSIDPKGNETVKTFDSSGRLEKVVSGNDVTIYSYYLDGSKKSITYYKLIGEQSSKGYSQEYSYNKDGTISSLTNRKPDGTPMDVTYYDYEKGNMKTRRELKNGVYSYTGYTYDALNRLTQVTEPDGKSTYYEYDAAGNRTKENVMIIYGGMDSFYSKETNYCYNSQNWLTNTTTWEYDYINYTNKSKYVYYSYDNNGNQLSTFVEEYSGDGSSNLYDSMYNEYDLRNQLVYTRTAEGTEVRSTYNGEGYRVAKSVKAPGEAQGKITYYLYEGDKVILELDSNRNQTGRNVYGTNLLFRTVGNRNSGTTYSYIYNGHGDVTALITDAGYVAATYRYDAFGNIIESTGNVDNSIRYAGYQYDVETGLYYINARMYDPLTARFLQEDTYTGNPNDPLSLNLYTYCHNDPVSYDDPTGHKRKNIVQKWVAKAKKAVKKTAKKAVSAVKKAVSAVKKAVSTAKKEIKKTIAKEKTSSKTSLKGSPPSYAAAGQRSSSKPAASTQAPTSSSLISESGNSVAGNIAKDIKETGKSGTGNSSWNQWDISKASSPGSVTGTVASGVETVSEVSKEIIPKSIINAARPNNIGVGTWAKCMEAEAATATSKLGVLAKGAKGAGYVAIGVDVGVGIYDNIQADAPTVKIASDAGVDIVCGAGGLAASTGAGALVGSVVPVGGTIVGAVVGFGVGLAYMGVTEIWQPGGQSIKDRFKEGLYNSIK